MPFRTRQRGFEFNSALVEALPKLRRFAYALAGNREEADDLLQAAAERALEKSERFEPGTNFEAWLFRLCRNLWIDRVRSRKTRPEVLFKEEMAPALDGARVLEAGVDLKRVGAAMGELSEDHRAVLALVGVEGLSYKEAAMVMDLPIGTVMSRLARARAQLADLVGTHKETGHEDR